MIALGVLCCVALPCCLFDLACFFLPSHLSLRHVYVYTMMIDYCVICYADVEGALSKALLVGNFEAAVDICIGADRMVRASLCVLYILPSLYILPPPT